MDGTLIGNLTWIERPAPQDWAVAFPGGDGHYISFGDFAFHRGSKGFTAFLRFQLDNDPNVAMHCNLLHKTDDQAASLQGQGIFYPPTTGAELRLCVTTTSMVGGPGSIIGNGVNIYFTIGGIDKKTGEPSYIGRDNEQSYPKFGAYLDLVEHRGQWMSLAVTYNGKGKPGGMRIYLNGARLDTGSFGSKHILSPNRGNGNLIVGGDDINNGLTGAIERVTFWDKALSAKAIARVHEMFALV